MTRFIRSLVLAAAMAGLVGLAAGTAAQDKTKTDTKPQPKATTKEEVGTVEVWMAKDGWRWKVLNAEGKTIAMGTTGFDKKEEAVKAIDVVKTTLNKAKVEVKDEKA
ncbi:MAG: DUF1508 domain-containing protein, partial [Gemmataceae bacterium]|nr:DUF1508 domain-containing protein [Gemmataceae bacterium]